MKIKTLNIRGFSHIMVPLVVIVGVAVIGTLFEVASRADTPTSASAIVGVASKCLDNYDNKKILFNKIELYTCNGSTAQQWTFNTTTKTITNTNGYCLDVRGAGTTAGTFVDLYSCNGTVAQIWTVNSANNTITYPHGYNLCLDDKYARTANGTQIQVYTCNGTKAQTWTVKSKTTLTPTPPATNRQAPTITSASSTSFTKGTASSFTVTATGSPTPVLSESGALPAGVSFNASSDTVAGTPTITGSFPITLTANNGISPNATQKFTITVVAAPVTTTASVEPLGVSGNWSLKFDTEFTGTTLPSSWNAEGPRLPNNSQEYDCYSPNNVSVGGGSLNMALTDTSCTVDGKSFQYTGSQIDTDGHFNPTYGYFEARVDAPGSNGQIWNWPAWWMWGSPWPESGEIDIFEGLDGYAGWHFDHADSSGNSVWQGSTQTGSNYTGWHVYGVDWQPNSITYYYDGVKVGTITSGVTNQPMRLVIDNTTSPVGNQAGPIVVPATLKVSYVRAWQ
jgi:beta-glucanase (GH16 family)